MRRLPLALAVAALLGGVVVQLGVVRAFDRYDRETTAPLLAIASSAGAAAGGGEPALRQWGRGAEALGVRVRALDDGHVFYDSAPGAPFVPSLRTGVAANFPGRGAVLIVINELATHARHSADATARLRDDVITSLWAGVVIIVLGCATAGAAPALRRRRTSAPRPAYEDETGAQGSGGPEERGDVGDVGAVGVGTGAQRSVGDPGSPQANPADPS